MKLVLIEWLDSHSAFEWEKLEELAKDCAPIRCRSVGWLVSEKNGHKLLVPHIAGENNPDYGPYGCGNITIPTGAITKITILRKK
jgi:hypothetical protein